MRTHGQQSNKPYGHQILDSLMIAATMLEDVPAFLWMECGHAGLIARSMPCHDHGSFYSREA